MVDGAALRPGDVVRHRDGTTTEAIVDVATLSGGGGLGPEVWAAIGNEQGLVDELVAAGARAGEPGWQLPLWSRYRPYLRSSVADRRNVGASSRYSFPTITAALYLHEFVRDTPWVHLDTSAVTARNGVDSSPAWPGGATGSPTRALVEWLRSRSAGI